ncbi:hypothetical protein PV325_010164, partial [Microctonus aethiopoides]
MLAIGTEDERNTERKAFTSINNNLRIRKTKYQEGDYLEDLADDDGGGSGCFEIVLPLPSYPPSTSHLKYFE